MNTNNDIVILGAIRLMYNTTNMQYGLNNKYNLLNAARRTAISTPKGISNDLLLARQLADARKRNIYKKSRDIK